MAQIIPSVSRVMRSEVARARIAAFRKRFKEPHYIFAQHAAFPLALTPDLLYRLWANFQRTIADKRLSIPWVAVADLLLSPLCEEVDVAYELYEMDLTVRDQLLEELRANPDFGPQRIQELAYFLENYVREQLNSSDPTLMDLAQSQRWTALAYIRPAQTAQELAKAVKTHYSNSGLEQVRVASLMETLGKLAAPLAEQQGFQPLLTYAQHQAQTALGNQRTGVIPAHVAQATTQVARSLGVTLPLTPLQRDSVRESSPLHPDTRSDFYISHHIDDHEAANWIATQLHAAGYTVTWAFEFGPSSSNTIDTGSIRARARYIIALLSPDYLDSENVRNEWTAVLDQSQREEERLLLPIRVRECTPQGIFTSIPYLDLVGRSDAVARHTLLQSLGQFLNQHPASSSLAASQAAPLPTRTPDAPGALETLVVYAHEDQNLLERLQQHLQPLEAQGLIHITGYRNISQEADWRNQVLIQLASSQIILLLISNDFLNSTFSTSVEVQRAIEQYDSAKARLIPILLKATSLASPLLSSLSALPADGRPVTAWPDLDAAFANITVSLREIISTFNANTLSSLEDDQLRLQELERKAQIQPDEMTYVEMGNLYESMRRIEEAIQAYEQARRLEPGDVSVTFALGLLYDDIGAYDKAIEYLTQLVEQRPDFAEAYKELGLAYRRRADTVYAQDGDEELHQNEYAQAVEYFERAVELRPDFEEALGSLGGVYRRLGDYRRALEYYQRIYAFNPDSSYALGNLGSLCWYLGRVEEAHRYFQRLEQVATLRVREQRDEARWDYYDLALAQLANGDLTRAQETYTQAISQTPTIPQLDAVLNNLYLLQKAQEPINGLKEIIAMLENAKSVKEAESN